MQQLMRETEKDVKRKLSTMMAIRTDPRQLESLQRIGQKLDRPLSWLIRKAIDEFIKRNEEKPLVR